MEYGTSKVLKRAHLILEIAQRMAAQDRNEFFHEGPYTFVLANRLEEITLHVDGYAESGYSPGSSGIVATGNWNVLDLDRSGIADIRLARLPERISNLFEKMGIECEWSDEWLTCDDCSKLIRKEPDSYWWEPYFESNVEESETVCLDCLAERSVEDEEV